MHTVYPLAIVTFIIVIFFALWSWVSTKRNQVTGGKTSGLGGPNDPMA